jgi:hypothetical protein
MSFGQTSGPPASAKQIAYLKSLLQREGHDDFRTARHVYGLTQRQAGGKFTTKEASALIDRLTGAEPASVLEEAPLETAPHSAEAELERTRAALVAGVPASVLAAELERRGWSVTPPS